MNIHSLLPSPRNYPQTGEEVLKDHTFTATAYGMVGTGHTPGEARRDLMEKIRQAGER